MKIFVMVPLLMLGAAAYNADLPKPEPLQINIVQPQAGIPAPEISAKKKQASDFENRIGQLDRVNQLRQALSKSA